ncbi:uncharacterized protein VNE69_12057 [Vairimorpha necatrix]|uniref:Uncharacterized protein n=1 Tax=Vairimorpha necatrix TaxID=6039 RepID=A0AAX4JGQ8_9MICR
MSKKIEYFVYSYTKDIKNLWSNFLFKKTKCQEFLFKKVDEYLIIRIYSDHIKIIKEEIFDKLKVKIICVKMLELQTDFKYEKISEENKEIYNFENEYYNLEMFYNENKSLYFIKLSAYKKEDLEKAKEELENYCKFMKPSIEI